MYGLIYNRNCNSFRLNNDPDAITYINIEFLTWPIIRYKREVLFGWVDLLVSFGGIAGLFLGFSLLSGVEIIYYFTMRAICMLFQNKVKLLRVVFCVVQEGQVFWPFIHLQIYLLVVMTISTA